MNSRKHARDIMDDAIPNSTEERERERQRPRFTIGNVIRPNYRNPPIHNMKYVTAVSSNGESVYFPMRSKHRLLVQSTLASVSRSKCKNSRL